MIKKNFDFPKTLLVTIDPWEKIEQNGRKGGKLTTDEVKIETCYLVEGRGSYNQPLLKPETFEKLVRTDLDWTKVKTLYRYPYLDLSRDKLGMIKDKYGTKIIRDPEKADVRVISNKFLHKLISTSYRASLSSAQKIITVLNKYNDIYDLRLQKMVTSFIAAVEDKGLRDIVFIVAHGYYHDTSKNNRIKSFMDDLDAVNPGHNYTTYIKGDNMAVLESLQDPSIKFVNDVYVNKVTSEDSIAIDHTNFEQVNAMLKNEADRSIGMTMMANCNIADSVTWLGMLFYHNWDHMKGSKIWNQVAFKTLKKQFEKYSFHYHSQDVSTYSSLIRVLIEDDALTLEVVNHIQKLIFNDVICGYNKFNSKGQLFEMDLGAVKLTDEAKSKIKKGESLSEQAKATRLHEELSTNDDLPF